jgi:hypothetical protein
MYPALPLPKQNENSGDDNKDDDSNNKTSSLSESFKQKRFKVLQQRSIDPLTWNAFFTNQNTG